MNEVMHAATRRTLADLPPADDEEAGQPAPVPLGLRPSDIEQLQALAQAWADARQHVTQCEQRHTHAERVASGLSEHQRRAGEVAARAFGRAEGHADAAAITRDVDAARSAAAALAALQRDVQAARYKAGDARAALHTATTEAIRQALLRASKRYGELSLELTRCIAALDAGMAALPQRLQEQLGGGVGWHVAMAHLKLPAMPAPLRVDHAGVANMNFVDMMLADMHPRLTAHQSAAHGWLQQQLMRALAPAGIAARSLLA